MRLVLPLLMLFVVYVGATPAAADEPVPVDRTPDQPLGLYTSHFSEPGARLTLEQALAAHRRGEFAAGRSEVLTFGIGPRPVWIRLGVSNPSGQALSRRLLIETAWLDGIDVYIRHDGATTATYQLGDRQAFSSRPVDNRHFAIDHAFAPGASEIYLRVATHDPLVAPIYLLSPQQAHARERLQDYTYGFLYGFLIALLAYNAMLYASLRHRRYIFYSLYLGAFVLMNLSYTGHGFEWFWPQQTTWAQWSNPLLMYLYGASGLLFATSFLNTRARFPRVHKTVLVYMAVFGTALLAAVLLGQQRAALITAFAFAFTFALVMIALGVRALRYGQAAARYFLLAAIAAMLGAVSTALSTWGFIPFSTWTFRAVEIGMLLDATLLALALSYQFRVGQQERQRAEQLATIDPLTGIYNRRAFRDSAMALWNSTRRQDQAVSVILLDIDRFKRINDAFGHAYGDEVLVTAVKVLTASVREQDVLARWGGEEFILLLPETDLKQAVILAERLRQAIAGVRFEHDGNEFSVTASLGVAQRQTDHLSLDALISSADRCLYHAKESGRNRVRFDCETDDEAPLQTMLPT